MITEIPINSRYLGADTLISPEVLNLLTVPKGQDKKDKTAHSPRAGQDDDEQVLGI